MTPLPRTKLGRRIDWLIVVAFALMAAGVMRAQVPIEVIRKNVGTEKPGERYFAAVGIRVTDGARLCGIDIPSYDKNTDLLQVACVDYDALRAVSPQYQWPQGKVTQVLVHLREGDAVRVTVDGVAKFADLSTDAWGRRVALVVFDGVEHTEVSVRVYRAVDE